jgi:hypothetical protein
MLIALRTPGLRLPRGRSHALLQRVRSAFRHVADQVARVLVHVKPSGGDAAALRDCTIEVHLRTGEVEVVQERLRRLAGVLAGALQRAWEATGRRLGVSAPPSALRGLHAPLHARLLPPPAARSGEAQRRG